MPSIAFYQQTQLSICFMSLGGKRGRQLQTVINVCLFASLPDYIFFPLKQLIKVYPTFPSTDVSNKRVDYNVLSWARERGDPGREWTPVPQGTLALLC